jgi:hypothetical protein
MMAEKICEWCGEPLGYEAADREPDSCGKSACVRGVQQLMREDSDNRAEDAREDGYSRY